MGEGDAAAAPRRPHGSRPLKGTKVPEKLVEWGMDQALWDWVKNKKSLAQCMDRGEEQKARWRIARLRELLFEPSDKRGLEMPPILQEWGCDEELWAKVLAKKALIDLADAGDEAAARERIAMLRTSPSLSGAAPHQAAQEAAAHPAAQPAEEPLAQPSAQTAAQPGAQFAAPPAEQPAAPLAEEPPAEPAAVQLVQQAVHEKTQKAALDEKEDDEEEEEAVDEMRGGTTDGAAQPARGAEEASAAQYFEVTCPEGLLADRVLRVKLPDWGVVDVRVPDGTAPGEAFLVGPL